jgi:hypothetical protein
MHACLACDMHAGDFIGDSAMALDPASCVAWDLLSGDLSQIFDCSRHCHGTGPACCVTWSLRAVV